MKPEEFTKQLKLILDQHIYLIKSNSELLQINLDLMKENRKLLDKFIVLKGGFKNEEQTR